MSDSIIDVSRSLFHDVVLPILEQTFPEETARTAFGIFGYGSEALRLDDGYSRDHHFGLRIDALMPAEVFANKREEMADTLLKRLPAVYLGYQLREGHLAGAGFAPDSLPAMLQRTIGRTTLPETFSDWLQIPEEDIIHVINGEVWHDPAADFSRIREAFAGYYPEAVRLRRIAHWCRYFSGMGTYALKRAILRQNNYYASIAFGKALRWGTQLAFMLEKVYCPYDKWTFAYLDQLPQLGRPVKNLVSQAADPSLSWENKLALLEELADLLDKTMVADGLIPPHPKFAKHPTSGYRLMEHAYAEIIKQVPDEIKTIVPVWDQIYLEAFHSGYVDGIDMKTWDMVLNLHEESVIKDWN